MSVEPIPTRRGARPRTSQQEILDVALTLLDTEGLGAVSFRRVAAKLGITPMPLYGYFDSKESLLNAMIAEAFPGISGQVDDQTPWQQQLAEVMRQLHSALTRHPGALDLLLSRADPDLDPIRETLIRILRSAGFDVTQAISLLTILVSFAIGSVVISYRRGDPAEEIDRLRQLPESEYPHLRQTASEYSARGTDETFNFSLDMLIAALASRARPTTTTTEAPDYE